jgi:hypothetical protein
MAKHVHLKITTTMEYRGFLIVPHYGVVDELHYHWGEPDEVGKIVVPMDCHGPTVKAVREYYGPNEGGCPTVEECQREIDRELDARG